MNAWPWWSMFSAIAAGFFIATIISLVISSKMMPDLKKTKKRPRQASIMSSELNVSLQSLSRANVEQIIARNIFNSEGKVPDDDKKNEEDNTEGEVESKLPLMLLGIIHGGSLYNGITVIQNTSNKKTNTLMVDDVIPELSAQIIEIHSKRIVIRHKGRREFILLKEKPIRRSRRLAKNAKKGSGFKIGAIAQGKASDSYSEEGFERKGNKTTLTDAYKQNILNNNLTKVLQDAKAVPHKVGGELAGWKLVNIRENSIYQKLGLQNGDVIREINGVPLTDAGKSIRTLNGFRNEKNFSVRIERNGTPQEMEVNVN